jgi:hypothetical protein
LVRTVMRRILVTLESQRHSRWEIRYDFRSSGNGFESVASRRRRATAAQHAPDIHRVEWNPRGLAPGIGYRDIPGTFDGDQWRYSACAARARLGIRWEPSGLIFQRGYAGRGAGAHCKRDDEN